MEKKPSRFGRLAIRVILVFLGTVAFACSLAAEFKKVKVVNHADARRIGTSSSEAERLFALFSAGEGYETGRKPLFVAEEPCVRVGDHGSGLPLDSSDRRDLPSRNQAQIYDKEARCSVATEADDLQMALENHRGKSF